MNDGGLESAFIRGEIIARYVLASPNISLSRGKVDADEAAAHEQIPATDSGDAAAVAVDADVVAVVAVGGGGIAPLSLPSLPLPARECDGACSRGIDRLR
eukprot:CAMPEP_0196237848 /NCGR_PEP_ID=MMETSP0913-20130531/6729_1 /TAXON_ID=49265 /ORGANISM="Thalassiosira rotula, Strain GSO102" /LENGTH=99 /DNA_ID=CAMNT_0041519479 /DNA_START=179 /DNA_END=477 /DNA_ORIENTATION=-